MYSFGIKIDSLKQEQIIKHSDNVTLVVKYFTDLIEHFGGDAKKAIEAAKVHDVGKLKWDKKLFVIPFKQLSQKDITTIYSHPAEGVKMLQETEKDKKYSSGNPSVYDIVYMHHERPDGKGYYRLKNIPIEVAVLSIADIFVACISERPYKGTIPVNIAIAEAVEPFKKGYFPDYMIEGIAIRLREIYELRNKPYDETLFSEKTFIEMELKALSGQKIDLKKYEPLRISFE